MARLWMCGPAVGWPSGSTDPGEAAPGVSTTLTSGTTFDTANQALKGVNAAHLMQAAWSGATATGYYARGYFMFDALPAALTTIMGFNQTGGTGIINCNLTTGGKLQLWRVQLAGIANAAQIGSDSALTLTTGKWYRIEMQCRIVGTAGNDTAELYVAEADGPATLVAGINNINITDTAPGQLRVGWVSSPTTGTIYVKNLALNDSTGTAQTAYPGVGHVALLRPVSDNARTGFTGGAAGTTNLWDALNNQPPVGVAVASATNTSQIKDKANNTTDNYVANLGAYTDPVASGGGGMGAADVVTLVQALVSAGQDSTTATAFALTISNPTLADASVGSGPAAAAGTWPTNWSTLRSAVVYAPTPVLGTAPTVKVRKGTASSTITQQASLLGLYVEYVPTVAPPPLVVVSQGVNRAASF